MPVLVVVIITTIWCLGWLKQLDAEELKAAQPTARSYYVAQGDPGEEFP